MSLAKTKKRKIQKKIFSEARPQVKKLQREFYSLEQINNFKTIINNDVQIYSKHEENILIIGLDEVGRGCVAGPVCTGAYSCASFYLHGQELLEDIIRSRQLSSGEFMSYSNRDLYYSETIINEGSVEEDLREIEDLSSLLLLEDSKQVPHAKREKLCDALLNVPSFSAASHLLYSTDLHSAAEIDSKGIVHCIWSSMTSNVINLVLQYFEFYHHYPEEVLLLVDGPKTIANISNLIKIKLYEREITDLYFIDENLILESKSLFKKLPDARHASSEDTELTESSMSSPRNEHNNADGTFGIGSKIILKQQAIVRGDSHSALIAAASNLAKSARDKYMRNLATKHTNYLWETNVGYGTKKHLEAIQTHGMTSEHRKSFLSNYEVN